MAAGHVSDNALLLTSIDQCLVWADKNITHIVTLSKIFIIQC